MDNRANSVHQMDGVAARLRRPVLGGNTCTRLKLWQRGAYKWPRQSWRTVAAGVLLRHSVLLVDNTKLQLQEPYNLGPGPGGPTADKYSKYGSEKE